MCVVYRLIVKITSRSSFSNTEYEQTLNKAKLIYSYEHSLLDGLSKISENEMNNPLNNLENPPGLV